MSEWVFYTTSRGRQIVRDEVRAVLPTSGATRLAALLDRIASGETLARDVSRLSADLLEARLTFGGQEFRLHFARQSEGGRSILLALHMVNKKARRASQQDIQTSESRLKDWQSRQRTA